VKKYNDPDPPSLRPGTSKDMIDIKLSPDRPDVIHGPRLSPTTPSTLQEDVKRSIRPILDDIFKEYIDGIFWDKKAKKKTFQLQTCEIKFVPILVKNV